MQKNENENKYNDLVDKLMSKAKDREDEYKLSEDEMLKLRKCCRSIFCSPDGKVVAKAMMRASGIYRLKKNTSNQVEMGAERGKEYMYLFFLKAMLTPEQLLSIETGGK